MKDRKLPENLDNPIDNFIINNGKLLYSIYKYFNFTPNTLTSISLILSLISSYLFYKEKYILSSILFFTSYSYDVFDGNYARKYNLVSQFGDYYDHIKDLICGIIFLTVFYKYNCLPKYLLVLSLFLIFLFFILSCLHLGFQEIYISKNDSKNSSHYLSFLKKISNYPIISNNIQILKYFGMGSLNLLVSIIIILNLL
jgi:phosphatidylglycerophosphate synthase